MTTETQQPEALTPLEAVRQFVEWQELEDKAEEVRQSEPESWTIPDGDCCEAKDRAVALAEQAADTYRRSHPALDAILRELEAAE